MDEAYIPRAHIVSVTGHRNEKSLDDYIDSFSAVFSKQLSNIISGRETVTGIETPVSFLVHPHLRWLINNVNSQFLINLENLAQIMENFTINITVNTNMQMSPPDFNNAESKPSNSSTVAKRRRVLPFYDSDSD
jgi:hypothetical protein